MSRHAWEPSDRRSLGSAARIRRATPGDSPALTQLMKDSTAYEGKYRAILERSAVSPEQIRARHVYLAELGSDVLGFYALVLDRAEAELNLLFVADAAQGRGVGAELFGHMRELARSLGCTKVAIVSHPPAEEFYLHMGAVRIATKLPDSRVTWPRPVLVLPTA